MYRLAVLAVPLLVAIPAAAQPHRATPTQVREAARVYGEALQLLEAGNPEAALPKFQQAYDLASPPNALFNIGACHEALRDFERALEFYERYLVEAPNADDRRDVQGRIAQIRAMRSHLTISSEPTGARIFVDAAAEPVGVTDRDIEVAPGSHVITLRLEGYEESQKTVTLLIGERKAIPFALRQVHAAEAPPPPPERIVVERQVPVERTRTIVVTREVEPSRRPTRWYLDVGLGFYQGFMEGVTSFAPNFNGFLAVGRSFPLDDRVGLDLGAELFFGGIGGDDDSSSILFPGLRVLPRLSLALSPSFDVGLLAGAGLMFAVGADDENHPILAGEATSAASLLSFEFGVLGRYVLRSGVGLGVTLAIDYTLPNVLADGSRLLKSNFTRALATGNVSYRF